MNIIIAIIFTTIFALLFILKIWIEGIQEDIVKLKEDNEKLKTLSLSNQKRIKNLEK